MLGFIRLLIMLLLLPLNVLAGDCDQFQESLIQVDEVHWCKGVNAQSRKCQQAVKASSHYTQLNYKPLYLWTRISGKKAAIDQLEACGKLPIYHKWYKVMYYGSENEQSQLIDEIPLCTGSRKKQGRCANIGDVADQLRLELQERGFFDWTTWSYKRHIYRGAWQVRLLYQDNTAVMCQGSPCIYRVKVKP